jgi:hypothetical protein
MGSYQPESPSTGIAFGRTDYAEQLARFSINFPELGGWKVLADFFGNTTIRSFRKREAALVLSRHADDIPEEYRSAIREAVDVARATLEQPLGLTLGLTPEIGGALDCLFIALSGGSTEAEVALLRLLIGDRQQRVDAAGCLARAPGAARQLAALVNDSDPEVAQEAASGLARSLTSDDTRYEPVIELVAALAAEDRRIGLYLVAGLTGAGPLSPTLVQIVETLKAHRSARVRRMAFELEIRDPDR